MKYAVVSLSGTQHLIREGQVITVNQLDPDKLEGTIDTVLLVANDDKVQVGNPTVKDASVSYEVLNQHQGEKIEVSTFKAKSRYHRHIGFRAQLTDIKITKITP